MPRTKRGKTQKKRASTAKKTLTIPELRSSMEYISSYSEGLVHKKASTKELAKEFASEWKRIFGKNLPQKVAESYIHHMMMMKKPKKGHHTRKHRGGGLLTGAPTGYQLGPGADIPYGKFNQYVDKGFWNPEPGIIKSCGTQQGILPPSGMGSNKMNGGGFLDSISSGLSAIAFRPFAAQNPPSVQQDVQSGWKGQPLGPGPESWQHTWKPKADNMIQPIVRSPVYERDLSQQGRV